MFRDITKDNPTLEELGKWLRQDEHSLKTFFNTRGAKYRELKLKDRLEELSEQEQLEILASDGLLVRRPLLIGENLVLIGFKEEEWQKKLLKD